MKDFKNFGMLDELVQSLERLNILQPTQIQIETIPPALEGSDLLASAQTGSGKTIAYSIPLITKLVNSDRTAIVLTPTRELAAQVNSAMKKICGSSYPLKSALLIGGDSMFKQIAQLRAKPNFIVGTPGRVFDHLNRGTLCLDKVGMLVIDEADRMLDMGFEVQLEQILEYLPSERQTLLFSATLPPNIEKLSRKYLKNPIRVAIGSSIETPSQLKQEIIHTTPSEKFPLLLDELSKREGSIVIFVKTKRGADRLTKELQRNNHDADAIHGDLPQRRRERVILSFRKGKNRILVATDIASRGLDIPLVRHVINYDLPQCPEDYIHRIGRTARAGAEGEALCLVTREDGIKWKAIHKMMNPGAQDNHSARKEGPPKRDGFRPRRRGGFKNDAGPNKAPRERSADDQEGAKKNSFKKKPFWGQKKSGDKVGFGSKPKWGAKRKPKVKAV